MQVSRCDAPIMTPHPTPPRPPPPPPGGDNTLVAIITYDSAVHFYNVQPGQPQQMLVMADTQGGVRAGGARARRGGGGAGVLGLGWGGVRGAVVPCCCWCGLCCAGRACAHANPACLTPPPPPGAADVYSPMSSQLLANLSKCKAELTELLHTIPTMFQAAAQPDSCGAAAMEVWLPACRSARARARAAPPAARAGTCPHSAPAPAPPPPLHCAAPAPAPAAPPPSPN